MKLHNLLILLVILYAGTNVYAQVPRCPCDTLILSDGLTGDDIIDILCPGGKLAEDSVAEVFPDQIVLNSLPPAPGQEPELAYVTADEGTGAFCFISNPSEQKSIFPLTSREFDACKARLIEGCSLLSHTIPTLSEWGLISMAVILGITGFVVIRRRKMTA